MTQPDTDRYFTITITVTAPDMDLPVKVRDEIYANLQSLPTVFQSVSIGSVIEATEDKAQVPWHEELLGAMQKYKDLHQLVSIEPVTFEHLQAIIIRARL